MPSRFVTSGFVPARIQHVRQFEVIFIYSPVKRDRTVDLRCIHIRS